MLLRYDSCVVDNSFRWFSDSFADSVDSVADNVDSIASYDDLLEFSTLFSMMICSIVFTLCDNLLEFSLIASDNDLLECSAFFVLFCRDAM